MILFHYFCLHQMIARAEEEERQRLEKADRAKRERRCPACDMKVGGRRREKV